MHAIVQLLQHAAVLALVLGGIATIIQITSIRAHAIRYAAGFFLISLFLPYAEQLLHQALHVIHVEVGQRVHGPDAPAHGSVGERGVAQHLLAVVAVVLGHVALAVYLLRRYLRDPEAARRAEAEREQVRRRERVRVPPQGEEP